MVSVSVGCGWMDSLRSVAFAPISMPRTPSAISSPAPGPTRPTPSSRSVSGSSTSFVRPSVRSSVIARPEAPHGNLAITTPRLSFAACVSVSPAHASSGSVHATEHLLLRIHSAFERDADALLLPLQRYHLRVQQHTLHRLRDTLREDVDEIPIGARQQARCHLYDRDRAAEGGIHGPELEADV